MFTPQRSFDETQNEIWDSLLWKNNTQLTNKLRQEVLRAAALCKEDEKVDIASSVWWWARRLTMCDHCTLGNGSWHWNERRVDCQASGLADRQLSSFCPGLTLHWDWIGKRLFDPCIQESNIVVWNNGKWWKFEQYTTSFVFHGFCFDWISAWPGVTFSKTKQKRKIVLSDLWNSEFDCTGLWTSN